MSDARSMSQHAPQLHAMTLISMDSPPPYPNRGRASMQAIHARLRRWNADIEPGSATYRAAVLLLAGLEYGQNIDVLARRTSMERSFVARAARRLIDNGVWQGGRTVAQWSALDEVSASFWNDVAVAEGKLCRRTGDDGSIEWAPAGYWNKSYQYVDPKADALNTVYHDAGKKPAEAVPLASERVGADLPPENAAHKPDEAVLADESAAVAPEAAGDIAADPTPEPSTTGKPGDDVEGGDAEDKPTPPSLMEIFSNAVWLR